MTKRFSCTDNGFIVDYQSEQKVLNLYDVVDLLNEQHETIQRLKDNIDELMKLDVEEGLLNENEQLKEERNYFERKKCEYFNEYNKKHLDNIQLKEENEQLKESVWSWSKSYNRVYEDNERILNTIKHAYYNERTQLGKSVLKQLLEAIQ